jgi:hypothetical protein
MTRCLGRALLASTLWGAELKVAAVQMRPSFDVAANRAKPVRILESLPDQAVEVAPDSRRAR